jgi:phosphatidylserine synthase
VQFKPIIQSTNQNLPYLFSESQSYSAFITAMGFVYQYGQPESIANKRYFIAMPILVCYIIFVLIVYALLERLNCNVSRSHSCLYLLIILISLPIIRMIKSVSMKGERYRAQWWP